MYFAKTNLQLSNHIITDSLNIKIHQTKKLWFYKDGEAYARKFVLVGHDRNFFFSKFFLIFCYFSFLVMFGFLIYFPASYWGNFLIMGLMVSMINNDIFSGKKEKKDDGGIY